MLSLSEQFESARPATPRVSSEEVESYQRFYELLAEWNGRFNLVSKNSLLNAFASHFVDSIWISDFAKAEGVGDFIDLGSGAGFPGVVFSIRHKTPVKLFERTGKKRTFLNEVRRALSLPIEVLEDFQGSKDVCTVMARAVLPPKELLSFLGTRIPRKSRVVLPLAKEKPNDIKFGGFRLGSSLPYSLPGDAGSRTVSFFERY